MRECACEGEQGGETGGEDGGKDALKLALLIWIDNHDIRYSLRVKRTLPPHILYKVVVETPLPDVRSAWGNSPTEGLYYTT